jgi:hypothetical protein
MQIDLGPVELDKRELVLLREDACNLGTGHEATLDEKLAQSPAGDALLARDALPGENRRELALAHDTVADEERPERRPGVESGFHFRRVSARDALSVSPMNG